MNFFCNMFEPIAAFWTAEKLMRLLGKACGTSPRKHVGLTETSFSNIEEPLQYWNEVFVRSEQWNDNKNPMEGSVTGSFSHALLGISPEKISTYLRKVYLLKATSKEPAQCRQSAFVPATGRSEAESTA